jgi:hypothetical protein
MSLIPELGDQLAAIGLPVPRVAGLNQLVADNGSERWAVLAVETSIVERESAARRLLRKAFRPVDFPSYEPSRFGLSSRASVFECWEAVDTFRYGTAKGVTQDEAGEEARRTTWVLKGLVEGSAGFGFEAWFSPGLYKSKLVAMPPSLARYAVTYYASSLVRYRPSMFDFQISPEQAFLFDAMARESAVPMLVDSLSAITGIDHLFVGDEGGRL